MQQIPTPYYLISGSALKRNLERIDYLRKRSGARAVLALKCFSTWSVFNLMQQYMDGTTSSSLFEARLGHEKFGKEVHAYSVVWSAEEVEAVSDFADKIIFNSVSQLRMFHHQAGGIKTGIRVNPGISFSHYDLADPARRFSRLGVSNSTELLEAANLVSGLMFHFNCENDDAENISSALEQIGSRYGELLERMEWISFGGGIALQRKGTSLTDFVMIWPVSAKSTECRYILNLGRRP